MCLKCRLQRKPPLLIKLRHFQVRSGYDLDCYLSLWAIQISDAVPFSTLTYVFHWINSAPDFVQRFLYICSLYSTNQPQPKCMSCVEWVIVLWDSSSYGFTRLQLTDLSKTNLKPKLRYELHTSTFKKNNLFCDDDINKKAVTENVKSCC